MLGFCTHFEPLLYQHFNIPLSISIFLKDFLSITIFLGIDIDIFQNYLIDIDIAIFQNCLINIYIFKNYHINIDIFKKCRYIHNRYFILIYRTSLHPGDVQYDDDMFIFIDEIPQQNHLQLSRARAFFLNFEM